MSNREQVYVLPWLLHLIGDIHQPLHTMQRFDRLRPTGDRGGNEVELLTGNLHVYWDSRIGSGDTDRLLTELALTIQKRHPRPAALDMDPEQWAMEALALRTQVYAFTGDATAASPGAYSDAYAVEARETSYERAALAAYRIAEVLNQRLK